MDPSLRPSPDRLTRRDLLRAGLAAGATLTAESVLAPRPVLAQQPKPGQPRNSSHVNDPKLTGMLKSRCASRTWRPSPSFDYGNRAATLWLDR